MAALSVNAVTVLREFGRKLEPVLLRFLEAKEKEAGQVSDFCADLVACIRDFTMRGGKRIRPAFVYYGYRCFADGSEEELLKAAISVELLHTYLLIHDDIMDGDELRRGEPTVHSRYSNMPVAARCRSAESFGEAMAIIAGDMSCAMAIQAITETAFPAELKLRAIGQLGRISMNVGLGQTLDLLSSCKDSFGEQDALTVNRLKTSEYTIEGPLHLGGCLAGASDQQLAGLSRYAIPLGQAFQIQDDILDLFGDEARTGKPIGSDVRQGKRTVLLLRAMLTADDRDRALMRSMLGRHDLTREEIALFRESVARTGALEYCRDLSVDLVNEARSQVPEDLPPEVREFLLGVAEHLIEREK